MPLSQVVINQSGPLPIQTQFTYEAVGGAMLYITGTAWARTANATIGFEVLIDGQSVGAAEVYANEAQAHKTMVNAFFPIELDYGPHQMMVAVLGPAMADSNDFFDVSIHYY